jgi:poly(beta-D-mannuronate) lyase
MCLRPIAKITFSGEAFALNWPTPRSIKIACLAAAIALLPSVTSFAAKTHAGSALKSPWDSQQIPLTDAPYACPEPVHLSPDLATNSFYSDGKSSVIDPERMKTYNATAGPYKELGNVAVAAADAYRMTGSRAAVQCLAWHLETAARDGVFTGKMNSNQAYYVQGWVIGAIAIAYLKVRDSGLIEGNQQKAILDWIQRVVKQTQDYYDERRQKQSDAENNHLYWAGVEVAAAGIAANNRKLFDWGIDTYHVGVAQIQPDGTLPREMGRGQRALHYHLFAAAPLVYLAEFGEDNGLDLYAERDGALKRLVEVSTRGLLDNSLFTQKSGVAQDTPHGNPTAEEIGWAKLYVKRFPDSVIAGLIARVPSPTYMYLGGLPPG